MYHLKRCAGLIASAAIALALAACSGAPVQPGGGTAEVAGQVSTDRSLPLISEVTPAADPRAWHGPLTIDLPQPKIEPIANDPQPDLPVTVTDTQGTKVTVKDTSRILAIDLYGTLSQTVFELGLGDNIIGRDISSSFPEIADRPLVTQNGHELNAEAILALDPTVVLTDTSLGPIDVLLQLRDAGIPVVFTDSERNLDNLDSLTQEVADALGVPDLGRKLGKQLTTEAKATQQAIEQAAPQQLSGRLRTVFLYMRGQAGVYFMFGEGSGADALISGAGGYDVSSEIGWSGMKPISDEGLIRAQPDAIVMMTKGLESVGGVEGLLERFPALAETPAGENERVIAMDDEQILSFGPRTADVLNALALALYAPDAL